ncbi:PHP domain-containing protein [Candidatus Altiarchaeota archaeon]
MLYELHTHSRYSDGIPSPGQIIDRARKLGLAGIAITDHNAIQGALDALAVKQGDVKVISGIEVSAVEGHILALDVKELIPRGLSAGKTVERIHSSGGIAIAAHPYDRYRKGVGDLILKLPFDAVEVVNAHTFGNTKDPVKMATEAGLPMTGGSDAHTLGEIGCVTCDVDGGILSAIKAGEIGIMKDKTHSMMLKHARGLFKRRLGI